jgi:MFS family permease
LAPFHLGIALVVLDALGRAFLLKDGEPVKEPPIPWKLLFGNPVVRAFAGAMVVASGTWTLLESALPLDMDARLRLDSRAIGLLFAVMALAHALTSPLMGRLSDRIGRTRVLRFGLVLTFLLLPLPAILPTPWAIGAAMTAFGVCTSFVISPCSPAMADQVERMGSQSFASGFSILNVSYSFGMMAGPLVGGALVQSLGLPFSLAVVGSACLAYLLVLRGLNA